MKKHYVYRITNKVENKHYYGCRTTKLDLKDDLGSKYFPVFSLVVLELIVPFY